MSEPPRLVLSCEHASARVPRRYARLFAGHEALLASHRGSDLGAAAAGRELARAMGVPLRATRVTRLLVDANRRASNLRVFSELSRGLPSEERERLLAGYHQPHREAVAAACGPGPALHVAVHSFMPELRGRVRPMDVGLLYDPGRPAERALAARWTRALRGHGLRVARNAPYRGVSDGLPTWLRARLGERYRGFELELNQRAWDGARWPLAWRRALVVTLGDLWRDETARPDRSG